VLADFNADPYAAARSNNAETETPQAKKELVVNKAAKVAPENKSYDQTADNRTASAGY